MTDLIRKAKGQPLRDAMKRSGLTQAELAAKTKAIDVRGKGVSLGAVVKVTGQGETASDTCRFRTAWLITAAMDEPLQDHFDMPSVSTDTVER
ncbi:XRE family transcriptional regulator [Streptomyces europaeiscabiei]|uniref:XRE family transcriptional regulator n=1 Tax=Streptomyces europaeiscabiei TaxID=146819 RepID=A0ABU4NW24_9ACTN|nr:XRE family transcriptional regulator [Streptomyces europaeiscabiei]MDX2760787.1 XRE family transcriptional regulator [Streptomyces europaeiscabiei]MDX3544376.1 XRE family transcriptional regulator [Streptomyces europaeiscabiei]MDX3558849.1 XRE family transcriptional regulator [Streptomyces europaeiscabiei]MDX3707215.1 XRE family transcriptional regulator [Streptomyces europaeiscabiei]